MISARLAACLAEKSPVLSKAIAIENRHNTVFTLRHLTLARWSYIAVVLGSWPVSGAFAGLVAEIKAELVGQPL